MFVKVMIFNFDIDYIFDIPFNNIIIFELFNELIRFITIIINGFN